MMFSEAFPKAVFVSRAENIKAQAKASWSLHTKNRSATQNDREKKTKTNKPVNAAPASCPAVLVDMRPLPNG